MTVVSVELLAILQAGGVAMAGAVTLGALMGPSQVAARLIELVAGRRRDPLWSLIASTVLVTAGLAVLLGPGEGAAFGIVLYGAGSGIRSIVRGTVPLALFGPDNYAALMGRLALPALLAQAASPQLGAALLATLGPRSTLIVLTLAASANVATSVLLARLGAVRPEAEINGVGSARSCSRSGLR